MYKKLLINKVNFNLKLPQFMWNSHALFYHNVIQMGDVPASLWELSLEINLNQKVLKLYTSSMHWKQHCWSRRKHALFQEELVFQHIVIQLFCINLWTAWTKYFTEPIMKSKLKSQILRWRKQTFLKKSGY